MINVLIFCLILVSTGFSMPMLEEGGRTDTFFVNNNESIGIAHNHESLNEQANSWMPVPQDQILIIQLYKQLYRNNNCEKDEQIQK